MKNKIIRWIYWCISVVFLCSFAAPDNQRQEETAGAPEAQQQIEKQQAGTPETDSTKAINYNYTNLLKDPRLSLILSLVTIVLTIAGFIILLRKQNALIKEIHRSQKRAKENLFTEVELVKSAIPNKIEEILKQKQSIFEEQERKKLEAQKEEQARRLEEEKLKKTEEEEERRREEEASRPYPSKTYYANYKASVGGFDEEFCNLERKANSTVVIKTTAADRAVFSLVNGIEPTAFTGILAACEVIQGSPESYNTIETREPGQLELRDGVWFVTAKVKIACL